MGQCQVKMICSIVFMLYYILPTNHVGVTTTLLFAGPNVPSVYFVIHLEIKVSVTREAQAKLELFQSMIICMSLD